MFRSSFLTYHEKGMNRFGFVTRTMAIQIIKTSTHFMVLSHKLNNSMYFFYFATNWQKITRFGKLEISFNGQYIEYIIGAGKL